MEQKSISGGSSPPTYGTRTFGSEGLITRRRSIDRRHTAHFLFNDQRFGATAFGTFFAFVNGVLGVGFAGLPYAFQIGGGWPMTCVIILGCIICSVSCALLQRCIDTINSEFKDDCEKRISKQATRATDGSCEKQHLMGQKMGASQRPCIDTVQSASDESGGWSQMAFYSGGQRFKTFVEVFVFGAVAMKQVQQIVLWNTTAATIFQVRAKALWSAVAGVCVFVCALLPSGVQSLINFVGVVLVFLIFALTIVTGVHMPSVETPPPTEPQANVLKAITIVVFTFADMEIMPGIYSESQNKENFGFVATGAFAAIGSILTVSGLTGYMIFGAAAQESVVANVGHDLRLQRIPNLRWCELIGQLAFALKILATLPVWAAPLFDEIELRMNANGSPGSSAYARIRVGLCQILLVAANCGVAFAAGDQLANVTSLVSILADFSFTIVFPLFFYYRLHKNDMTMCKVLLITLGITSCLTFQGVAFVGTVRDMVSAR